MILSLLMDDRSVKTIKGIGDKTAKLFEVLGVCTVDDLIRFYPVKYLPYASVSAIEETSAGQPAAVCAILKSPPHTIRAGKLRITETVIEDFSGKIRAVWYNSPYIAQTLHREEEYVFAGNVVQKKGTFYMEHPLVYRKEEYFRIAGKLKPVYRLTKGLSQNTVSKAVRNALEGYPFEEDYLPVDIKERYGLTDQEAAIRNIHLAEGEEETNSARRRIVFDEFFSFLYSIRRLKQSVKKSGHIISTDGILEEFSSELPFRLTEDQKKAVGDIFRDLSGGSVMNRLIEGDVGSGKTAVALCALYAVFRSGGQGAIMVPTEVLANQHFRNARKLFENFRQKPETVLITGSMTAAEKREAYERVRTHQADIVIGTHALIQEKLEFDKLCLVITDEQHRFGVRQRESLSKKGDSPHILVMSATPIPRTLAVILYGDLDVSEIRTKPAGRLPVKNAVITAKDRKKAYRHVAGEIAMGHQAYIICPLIEAVEDSDAENVLEYAEKIGTAFPEGTVIECIHGRLKETEKDRVMRRFSGGDIDILVSTTVIEVGVDVPNATVMMIENAERFGLAALHQLRGRVGRGNDQSYCIFVRTSDAAGAVKRLDVIGTSNDGFQIASEDLRLRGPGEILGHAQSGQMKFETADIYGDSEILREAYDCTEYIETDAFRADDMEMIRFFRHMEEYRDKTLNNLSI